MRAERKTRYYLILVHSQPCSKVPSLPSSLRQVLGRSVGSVGAAFSFLSFWRPHPQHNTITTTQRTTRQDIRGLTSAPLALGAQLNHSHRTGGDVQLGDHTGNRQKPNHNRPATGHCGGPSGFRGTSRRPASSRQPCSPARLGYLNGEQPGNNHVLGCPGLTNTRGYATRLSGHVSPKTVRITIQSIDEATT